MKFGLHINIHANCSFEIDRSGTVDLPGNLLFFCKPILCLFFVRIFWEFLYSIMGEDASKYGYLSDMELVSLVLCKNVFVLFCPFSVFF